MMLRTGKLSLEKMVALGNTKKFTHLSGSLLLKVWPNHSSHKGKFEGFEFNIKSEILPVNIFRSSHTPLVCFSSERQSDYRKEKMKNYVILVIIGLWASFILYKTIFAPVHADYVLIEADEKKN